MKAFTTAAIAMSMAMAALAAPEVAQSNMLNSLTDRQFDSYEAPSAAPISGGDVSWTTVTNTGSSSSWSSQGAASDYGQYDAGLTTGNNAGLSFGGSFDLGLPGFVQNLLYSALIIMGLTSLFGIAKNLITQFKPGKISISTCKCYHILLYFQICSRTFSKHLPVA